MISSHEQNVVDKYNMWLESTEHDWHLFMNYGFSDSTQEEKDLFKTAFCNWNNQANLYKKCLDLSGLNFFKEKYSLLEVGCGRGGGLMFLRDNYAFKKLVGVDLNEGHINYAAHLKKNISFILGTARNIPHDTESMDVILSVEVEPFSHYILFLDYVKSCYKTLKKDGVLIQAGFHGPFEKNQRNVLVNNGFNFVKEEDISLGVRKSIKECEEYFKKLLLKNNNKSLSQIVGVFENINSWGWPPFEEPKYGITIYKKSS